MGEDRVQKILSRAGVASRRASEQLMRDGRVTVNGTVVRTLGAKADPARDDIRVDGRHVKVATRHRYLLLNKPRGYVTTRSDPQGRPTVIDLLRGVAEYVYPVGRLDFDSEGLIMLTNDGDLAARLTHPRHGVPRVYVAQVTGIPDDHDLRRLSRGIVIDGRRTAPATVKLQRGRIGRDGGSKDSRAASLIITVREGRNRQVRKMCEAIGHPVLRLKRIAIGPIKDAKLKPAEWRDLTKEEVATLEASLSAQCALQDQVPQQAGDPRSASARSESGTRGRAPRSCPRLSAGRSDR
jgi:23S rRNA pseudouridine2605 synthase